MPIEVTLVKGQDGALRPASAADQEHMGKFKTGQAVRVSVTQIKSRSLQHHRLYWGGLIELAMDYWSLRAVWCLQVKQARSNGLQTGWIAKAAILAPYVGPALRFSMN